MPVIPAIELPAVASEMLEFLVEIADLSSDEYTVSREDIIAISLMMYRLSFQKEYRDLPALIILGMARNSWFAQRDQGGQSCRS